MDIGIMIEGQDGLTWTKWQRLARAVEDLGFTGLYRSDHYTNASPPNKASLELWISLTWLASHTARIAFGPLVTPASFRHPSITARMAAAVDDLSKGRLRLGLGAGWQAREHQMFGRELLDVGPRFDRFREYLEVVTRLLRSDEPVSFEGEYYALRDAILLPRPQRSGGPPITVGGNGPKRTLPLAAEFADEWNAVFCTPERWMELNARLDHLLAVRGRDPDDVRRTMMTTIIFGSDEAALRARLEERGQSATEARSSGAIVGTSGAVRDQLSAWAEAGLDGVMLQWLDMEDVEGLAALSEAVREVL